MVLIILKGENKSEKGGYDGLTGRVSGGLPRDNLRVVHTPRVKQPGIHI
jgi:hypothetical protein